MALETQAKLQHSCTRSIGIQQSNIIDKLFQPAENPPIIRVIIKSLISF